MSFWILSWESSTSLLLTCWVSTGKYPSVLMFSTRQRWSPATSSRNGKCCYSDYCPPGNFPTTHGAGPQWATLEDTAHLSKQRHCHLSRLCHSCQSSAEGLWLPPGCRTEVEAFQVCTLTAERPGSRNTWHTMFQCPNPQYMSMWGSW